MKFIFLFLIVFSCSHHTSTDSRNEKTTFVTESAGESDAQQVSPYTVKPCYCMKIFKPVCADGKNYGNSCEAECNGHKTWTEGSCAKKTSN
jgi:hypothetical protein